MARAGRLLLAALCLATTALAGAPEGDDLFVQASPLAPTVRIVTPTAQDGVPPGNLLTVALEASGAARLEVSVLWPGGEQRADVPVESPTASLQLPPIPGKAIVTARAFSPPNSQGDTAMAEERVTLLSPRETLAEAMIDLAYRNSKDRRYNFAPAQTDTDIGVCKNFVMRMFDTNKAGYSMLAYPGLALHMPKNNWKADVAPYQYGIEWAPDPPESGNPFEVAAKFRYDKNLDKAENQRLARAFLQNAKRGDCYQMVGNYVDGNGPHSLLMIADYDPEKDLLRWTDSNMKGTRIDGVRWGWIQWDCQRTVDWMVKAICSPNRGATLYRLRADLVHD
ncbi:MAG: hypothetical protein LBU67_01610 [Oscillospiraceae bacterium]|jgi:hypothetical protein|nr:hypothetical protein [Oscillospiraceae bacterium]